LSCGIIVAVYSETTQMKTTLLLFVLTFALPLVAQPKKYVGNYEMDFDINGKGVIEYQLSLNEDGTFLFHFYRKIDTSHPDENQYGKGNWKVGKANVLYFTTNENNDLDETHTLNFTNSKARFYEKSPRDKSAKIIKKHLRFYDSDIPWVKGMKLIKKG